MLLLTTRSTPVAKQYQLLARAVMPHNQPTSSILLAALMAALGLRLPVRKVVEECSSGEWQHREERDGELWMSSLLVIEQCYQQLA